MLLQNKKALRADAHSREGHDVNFVNGARRESLHRQTFGLRIENRETV